MICNVDIETALYELLIDGGYTASTHTLPIALEQTLPAVHVVRTGGYTTDMVIEINNVDFDVYAENDADAMETAAELCGWVRSLAGQYVDTQCYRSEITTLPYRNPDPRHPNIARATFKAEILVRAKGA